VNQQIASTLSPDLCTTASIVEPYTRSVLPSILQATELIVKQDPHQQICICSPRRFPVSEPSAWLGGTAASLGEFFSSLNLFTFGCLILLRYLSRRNTYPCLLEMDSCLDESYYSHQLSSPPCILALVRTLGHTWSIEKETRSHGHTNWPNSSVIPTSKEPFVPNQRGHNVRTALSYLSKNPLKVLLR
jgi:hypothetical protein